MILGRDGDFESLPTGFSTENEEKKVPDQKGKDNGCAANPGYAEIQDNTAQVPTFLMSQLYSVALTAYSTGSKNWLDFYYGVCSEGGIGYIYQ